MRCPFLRRTLPSLAAVAVLGLVIPVHGAGAASTPKCLSRKADYVATKKSVVVELRGPGAPQVIKLKGGNNTVHISYAAGTVFICGGDGRDEVYDHVTSAVRFDGAKGDDQYIIQGACPGKAEDETRAHNVEYTNIYACP